MNNLEMFNFVTLSEANGLLIIILEMLRSAQHDTFPLLDNQR
jgi:hypothetical protein